MRIVKTCRCGASYSAAGWARLALCGHQRSPEMLSWGEREHELRHCAVCGSTIAVARLSPLRRVLTIGALLVAAYAIAWGIDALTHVSPLLSAGALLAVCVLGSVAALRWGALLFGLLLGGCGSVPGEHATDDAGADAPVLTRDARADVHASDAEVDAGGDDADCWSNPTMACKRDAALDAPTLLDAGADVDAGCTAPEVCASTSHGQECALDCSGDADTCPPGDVCTVVAGCCAGVGCAPLAVHVCCAPSGC